MVMVTIIYGNTSRVSIKVLWKHNISYFLFTSSEVNGALTHHRIEIIGTKVSLQSPEVLRY